MGSVITHTPMGSGLDNGTIWRMALDLYLDGIFPEECTHPDGTPLHEFMVGACDTYRLRFGKAAPRIGDPAYAVLATLNQIYETEA